MNFRVTPHTHTTRRMSSKLVHNLSTGADMSVQAASPIVTAQDIAALYRQNEPSAPEWPVSGDMTTASDAVPLGDAMAQHLEKTHGARTRWHLGVLWGSTDNWCDRDTTHNPSRRIVAVGTDGEPGMVVRYVAADGAVSMRQFGDDHRKF